MLMSEAREIHQRLDKDLTTLSELAAKRRPDSKRLVGCVHPIGSFRDNKATYTQAVNAFRFAILKFAQ